MDSVKILPPNFECFLLPTSLSQQLNISVEDPNNNSLTGQKSTSTFNDSNLLLSTNINRYNSTSTSVIVKHESAKCQLFDASINKMSTEIHRPIPTDQENFFANNPSIFSNNSSNSINELNQIASHSRIAFRRISAPALLTSQLMNSLVVKNLNSFALHSTSSNRLSTLNSNESTKLAEILLRQQFQLNKPVLNENQQIPTPDCMDPTNTKEEKFKNFKRRNSEPANSRSKNRNGQIHFLWEFLLYLLSDKKYSQYICWLDQKKRIFKLLDSRAVSNLWGMYKGKTGMNYETMARALRYYYQKSLLRKINGRLVYQFVNLNDRLLD